MASLTSEVTTFSLRDAVDVKLARLRSNVDDFAITLGGEYGENHEAVHRAEQLSAAIQRLEWALARQRPRSRSAVTGGF